MEFTMPELEKLMSEVCARSFDDKIKPLLNKEPEEYIKALRAQQAQLATPKDVPTGQGAARIIMALASAKGDPIRAAVFAQKAWGEDSPVVKALSSADATAGGFLLQDEMATDIIELLRPASVVLGSPFADIKRLTKSVTDRLDQSVMALTGALPN